MTPLDLVQPEHPSPVVRQAPPVWMIAFVDLVSLLVAFFVMLFALSSGSSEQWRETARPVDRILARNCGAARTWGAVRAADRPRPSDARPWLCRQPDSRAGAPADPVLAQIHTAARPMVSALEMPAAKLIEPNGESLQRGRRLLLDHLAPAARGLSNPVEVQSMASPVPNQPSVWRSAAGTGLLVAVGWTQAGFHPGRKQRVDRASRAQRRAGRIGAIELIIRDTDGSPR